MGFSIRDWNFVRCREFVRQLLGLSERFYILYSVNTITCLVQKKHLVAAPKILYVCMSMHDDDIIIESVDSISRDDPDVTYM